ncbi:MAG: hypothetical protein V3V74_06905 [Nitrosomonadaceae bacterium]
MSNQPGETTLKGSHKEFREWVANPLTQTYFAAIALDREKILDDRARLRIDDLQKLAVDYTTLTHQSELTPRYYSTDGKTLPAVIDMFVEDSDNDE